MDPLAIIPITVTGMLIDAHAAGDAVLRDDYDEARFRTHLLALKAGVLGLCPLCAAALRLEAELGPLGRPPGIGYGATLLRVADELESIESPL